MTINSLKDGKALSLALKLKNKNKGINQTQTAKNAATSPKLGLFPLFEFL